MAFTYFLRDQQTLERIVEHVVPYASGRSRVRVWDAGCATGKEPYSLAMLFAENMGNCWGNTSSPTTTLAVTGYPSFFETGSNTRDTIFFPSNQSAKASA